MAAAPSPGRGASGTGKSPKEQRTAYVYGDPVEILKRSQGGYVVRFLDTGEVETVSDDEVAFGA